MVLYARFVRIDALYHSVHVIIFLNCRNPYSLRFSVIRGTFGAVHLELSRFYCNNNNNNNNVKTKAIPVIIGATGTISKSFRKYVSNIPGKHEVKELQKTAILGTAHILRKALM